CAAVNGIAWAGVPVAAWSLKSDLVKVSLGVASHHMKVLIVHGSGGPIAFCGGVDINPDRRDSPAHGAPGAFHDVHARVEGPAVADVHRSFVDRWNSHPDRLSLG